MSAIIDEARNGNLPGVKRALAMGADINETANSGDTALICAAYKGHADIVRLLLENGADVAITNSGGWNALRLAQDFGGAATLALITDHLDRPKSPWNRLDDDVLAHVATYPAIRQSLTTLFNFKSRERFVIARCIDKTGQSITPPTPFDALPRRVLEEAVEQFTQAGGNVDRDYVFSGTGAMDKPKLKSPQAG